MTTVVLKLREKERDGKRERKRERKKDKLGCNIKNISILKVPF